MTVSRIKKTQRIPETHHDILSDRPTGHPLQLMCLGVNREDPAGCG